MRSRFMGCLLVALVVSALFAVMVTVRPVQAWSTITISPDGTIQPDTAPIQRTGSLYTLTENITFNNPGFESAIRIECSNITFNGNGCTLNNASDICLYVIYATNVTITNTTIRNADSIGVYFYQCRNCTVARNFLFNCCLNGYAGAIHIANSRYFTVTQNTITGGGRYYGSAAIYSQSQYDIISANQIYNVFDGLAISSSDSTIQGNTVRNASNVAISLAAQDARVLNNNVSDSGAGTWLSFESQSNMISGNRISNSEYYGIRLDEGCQYSTVTENNVTNTRGLSARGDGIGIYVRSPSYQITVSRNWVMNSACYGLRVEGWYGHSVTDNYVVNSGEDGILCQGGANAEYSDFLVSGNYVANSTLSGIQVSCNQSVVSANTAVNNSYAGITLSRVYQSSVFDNRISNNGFGLRVYYFGNNSIYHNYFTDNTQHVDYTYWALSANSWDDGYPSGGNYWSDYVGVDLYKGPNQDVPGSDGIGDTPYAITTDNVDRYPRISAPAAGALTISPNYGGNTGNVTARITGLGFSPGIVAKLVRMGVSNITGSTTNIINSTQLITTFNLAGIEPDTTWDLVVAYPNGTERTLEYAFEVMLGGEPIIYTDIIGRPQLRIGHSAVYTIRVSNRGNVDATDQLLTLYTGSALKILSVRGPTGGTIWNRTALEQTIAEGQLQHPELWPSDSSQAVTEFLNTTVLYAPRISAGDCLTLQVEVYAKIPWNPMRTCVIVLAPLVLIVAKVAVEMALTHILAQIISSELLYQGVDDLIAEQLRSGSYPVTGSLEVTQILVEYLLEEFGSTVGASVGSFGRWGAGALTGLGLALEIAKKISEHSRPEASDDKSIEPVSSYDPNDKTGPTGSGLAAYVPATANLTYTIYFENLANATASAEDIVITDQLDPDLDWTTLSIGGSSHPDTLSSSFNATTGTITWIFTGINLPPNVNPPEGEGWVRYSVSPKAGLATDTEIRNKATIVFDVNPPINTPETLHTIDASPPESTIQSLPAQSNSSFTLSWSGTDSGSGVKAYTVYYADNDGPWVVWLLQTQETSATFDGQVGHTYQFYTRATDDVGNWEDSPQDPDATTTVDFDTTPPETQLSVGSPRYVDLEQTEYVTSATPLSLTASDNEGGFSGVASTHYHLFNTTYDSGWQAYLSAFHLGEVTDGNYTLEYRSTDKNGNTENAKKKALVLDNKAPEASVVIDYGAGHTNSTEITLQLAATDVLQNTIEVRFSNDNVTYTEWEAYAPAKNWTLASGYGPKTVYVQFKDFLGQVSTASSTIEVIPEFPSLLILPLLMLASLITAILGKRRRPESSARRTQP